MSAATNSTHSSGPGSDPLVRALASERARLHQFAAAERKRLDALHETFDVQFQSLECRLTSAASGAGLENLVDLERELESRRNELAMTERRLADQQSELQRQRREHAAVHSEADELRARLDEKRAQLEHQLEAVDAERLRTKLQRRRLAEEIRGKRNASRGDGAANTALEGKLRRITSERDELREQLEELQSRPAPKVEAADDQDLREEMDALRNKYDMAMADLREMRKRNVDLEQRAAAAPGNAPAADNAMDWESQKRRLLASLEAESNVGLPSEKRLEERLTIDGTIRITDQVIAEKDDEIAELKRLLENQSQNVGQLAIGAAALGELLDGDEIVRQERERLRQMQDEWEEKMRFAEIENSRERAKLARERQEIDELRRSLEHQKPSPAEPADPKKRDAASNRWFARLGLKGDES